MAACDDRQLTEAQRQAALQQQQRAGVMRAVRPFTGNPTVPNLVDYINRELFPAIKQARDKLNEVFRQVTDNAPSGNPLQFYFAEETANADPTTGRIRLDNATQNLATTIRVSETNGRLASAAPWLDVMAGGATAPLGVVTLTDANDPTRFLRFDLDSMVDQGTYWDLGVTPVESSHDSPFVAGEPIAIGFIPGVGGITPATVPTTSMSDIGANTVLCNPTASPAPPTDLTIPTFSLLGRRGANIEAVRADEFVPAFFATTANLVPQMSNAGTAMFWGKLSGRNIVDVPEGTLLLRADPTTGPLNGRNLTTLAGLGLSAILNPNYNLNVNGSTSIIVDFPATNEVQRAALTGDVTASQNSNATTIATGAVTTTKILDNAVTDGKLRDSAALSVIGRSANSIGDPADIATTAASDAVLRESGSAVSFGTVATGGIANDAVTDPKLRNSGALSVIGRSANTSGDPADISGTASSDAVLRISGTTLGFGTVATAGLADASVTNAKLANMAAGTVKGRQVDAVTGVPVDLTGAEVVELLRIGTVQTVGGALPLAITLADDTTFLSITTNGDGDVQTVTGSTFGRVVLVAMAGTGTKTIKHAAGGTSQQFINPGLADFQVTVRDAFLLVGLGTVGWQVVSAPLGINRVGNAQLRDSGALSVIGRSANSSGDPADISASAASGAVLRESGSTIGFGTIATAGLADASVTLAKMANLAAGTVIGRQIDAGTGVPVALTGGEIGENIRQEFVQTNTLAAPSTPLSPGTYNDFEVDYRANALVLGVASAGDVIITGIQLVSAPGVPVTNVGKMLRIQKEGATGRLLLAHADAGSTATNQFWTPLFVSFELNAGFDGVIVLNQGARWRFDARIIPTTGIADNAVTNAKIRQSGALSVIGRSANSTGNAADVSATAASDAVLRESGSTIGFGTIATGGIANNAVTDAKLRQSAGVSVVGRSANSTGNVADITAGADDRVLVRRSGALSFTTIVNNDITAGTIDPTTKLAGISANSVLGNNTASTTNPIVIAVGTNSVLGRVAGNIVAAQVVTAQITDANVTDAKISNRTALSVFGRSANSSGVGADIAATAASDAVLRESGSAVSFGTIATGGIANSAVTLAKMADLAQSRIIGRAEGAGTGVPTALTPTQVVSIIDGESPTWTDSHRFDSYVQFQVGTGLPIGGDIRKGTAGVLDIRGFSGIELCGNGGVVISGATPSNAGTLLIRQGSGSSYASITSIQLTGSSVVEPYLTDFGEQVNNLCHSVNSSFSSTITAASTQLDLFPTFTIPANSWTPGRTYTAIGHLVVARGATGTACDLRSVHGLSGGFTETLDMALPGTLSANYQYRLEYVLTCVSTGAGGTFMHSMRIVGGEQNNASASHGSADTSVHSIDTTASQTIRVQVNMTSSIAGLALTRTVGYINRTY